MNQALARFERYIKRRIGQTSTLKHYISDLNIFIDTVDTKAPEAVTAEDIDTFLLRTRLERTWVTCSVARGLRIGRSRVQSSKTDFSACLQNDKMPGLRGER